MIYLDHAATTYLDPRVFQKMLPYFKEKYGNPSSLHAKGQEARQAVDEARAKTAEILNCKPQEVIFTGSGTESCNLAVKGIAEAYQTRGKHLITSKIEHHAVLHPFEYLEKNHGFKMTYLNVDRDGIIKLDELKKALTPETTLVSIMNANNEIGTIQPLKEIAEIIHEFKLSVLKQHFLFRSRRSHSPSLPVDSLYSPPFFHTDACQGAGALELDIRKLGVDALSINGGKIYGPKGLGALYLRQGVKIVPQMVGGGQEYRLRAGTENVPGIVGLAEALVLVQKNREKENQRLIKLRDKLITGLLKIPRVRLNGHPEKRLPNNINISVYGVEGESMLLRLDLAGICVSTGSACTSGTLDPSHVLLALGLSHEQAQGSLRLTLGHCNTEKDVEKVLEILPQIIQNLRKISPL